jgi:SH3 domain-containing protein
MKKCAYCTAENRDEAIFCNQCRRPLPARPSPPRIVLLWLGMVFVLTGLGSYLFSSHSLSEAPASQTGTEVSSSMLTAGPVPTRTQEPITMLACVEEPTRIRRGPGTHYETISGLPSGACLTILGRNEEASWVYIISDDDLTGWIAATTLTGIGNISRVSVRDDSAMVNTARPTLTSEEIAHGAQVYLTQISATNQARAPLSEYVEPCFEAVNRIGHEISCRLEKAYCDYFPEVEGSPTVCIDRPAPDHTFALVVFDQDWSEYDGQCLIVSGFLEVDWGMMQIQALRRDQISSCE